MTCAAPFFVDFRVDGARIAQRVFYAQTIAPNEIARVADYFSLNTPTLGITKSPTALIRGDERGNHCKNFVAGI